ncbi:hypothetical protein [Stenotrophomonas sp. PS02289]|uniref:hypothetical protein n=1 Tax=Stenotrophomonas sp. PS02289 TaxID=2991422 RepID=UPI00249AA2F2|nr:hypothetical protein [Stenotrophomonas sp. PS02289]
MNILELAIAGTHERHEVIAALARVLGVYEWNFIDEHAYWKASHDARTQLVGYDLVRGRGTHPLLLVAYCVQDVYGEALGVIGGKMARLLNVEVAVGDFMGEQDVATCRLIVYAPDGSYRIGFDCSVGGELSIEFPE